MNTSRRSFIKGAAAVGAFNIIPARVLWGATAPSNQLTRALIGFGGIARSVDLGMKFGNHMCPADWGRPRIIALCDPDSKHTEEGIAKAKEFGYGDISARSRGKNFMDILADKDVDIVHICTPPHWHGCMSAMAAKAKKDIWCEKPMTRTVGEGIRVAELVKANKVNFRLNTWFRYDWPYYGFGTPVKPIRQIVENNLVSSKGKPMRCVFGAGQGFDWKFFWSGKVNLEPQPVPENLDWDMWLGPAPWKPYNKHRCHGTFRGYWDFDAGGLGDMAQHYLDPLQYLLCKDETSPVKIDYVGPKHHPEVVGRFDRITLTYADGTEVILDGDQSLKNEPFLRGDLATMWPCKDEKGQVRLWTSHEQAKTQMFGLTDNKTGKAIDVRAKLKELPEPKAQITDFYECCRTNKGGNYSLDKRFCLNEDTGFRSCTMFNLAIVAERLGCGFEFDPVALRAKNDTAADRFLYQSMREPWRKEMFEG